jgi:hypothetical protein
LPRTSICAASGATTTESSTLGVLLEVTTIWVAPDLVPLNVACCYEIRPCRPCTAASELRLAGESSDRFGEGLPATALKSSATSHLICG